MPRNKAMRRVLRAKLGTRSMRRQNTKVIDGSKTKGDGKGNHGAVRKRAQKPSTRLSELERYLPE